MSVKSAWRGSAQNKIDRPSLTSALLWVTTGIMAHVLDGLLSHLGALRKATTTVEGATPSSWLASEDLTQALSLLLQVRGLRKGVTPALMHALGPLMGTEGSTVSSSLLAPRTRRRSGCGIPRRSSAWSCRQTRRQRPPRASATNSGRPVTHWSRPSGKSTLFQEHLREVEQQRLIGRGRGMLPINDRVLPQASCGAGSPLVNLYAQQVRSVHRPPVLL